jgi:hypothetical protein
MSAVELACRDWTRVGRQASLFTYTILRESLLSPPLSNRSHGFRSFAKIAVTIYSPISNRIVTCLW